MTFWRRGWGGAPARGEGRREAIVRDAPCWPHGEACNQDPHTPRLTGSEPAPPAPCSCFLDTFPGCPRARDLDPGPLPTHFGVKVLGPALNKAPHHSPAAAASCHLSRSRKRQAGHTTTSLSGIRPCTALMVPHHDGRDKSALARCRWPLPGAAAVPRRADSGRGMRQAG